MHPILEKLQGGGRRSIGRANEVVQQVLRNPALLGELFKGMRAGDRDDLREAQMVATTPLLERDVGPEHVAEAAGLLGALHATSAVGAEPLLRRESAAGEISALEQQTEGVATDLTNRKMQHETNKRECQARLAELKKELSERTADFARESTALGKDMNGAGESITEVASQRASIGKLTEEISQFRTLLASERKSAQGFLSVEIDGEVPAAFLARLRDQLGSREVGPN